MAPPEERYPFHGKIAFPTSVPSPAARLENLNRKARASRRKKFLIALLAGQLLVLLLDFGGDALLHLLRNKLQYRGAFPLRTMVFLGMTSTIVAIAILLFLVLGFKGTRYVLGPKKVGFLTALWIGIRRVWNEAWALGLILGVIGGTAWFLIKPDTERDALKAKGREYIQKGKSWIGERLPGPQPAPPPPRDGKK
jgi:hypothetical protein